MPIPMMCMEINQYVARGIREPAMFDLCFNASSAMPGYLTSRYVVYHLSHGMSMRINNWR